MCVFLHGRYLTGQGVPLVSVQIQYSLLSQTDETAGAAAACRDLGLQMIAYSPLALGLLSGRYSTSGSPSMAGDDLKELPRGPRGQLFKGIVPGKRQFEQQRLMTNRSNAWERERERERDRDRHRHRHRESSCGNDC